MLSEGATPVPIRSSGTWLTPRRMAVSGSPGRTGLPATTTEPAVGLRMPVMTSASSRWPLPATPATPTISPAWTVRDTSRRAKVPRSPRAETPNRSRITSRSARAGPCFFWVKTTSRPTIIRASSRGLVSVVGTVPITFPRRSTVTRRETAITSSSLWEMKITVRPSAAIRRSVSKRFSDSWGVSREVGSSRIRMRAPR